MGELMIEQKQERFLHVALPLCVTVIANIIAVSTLSTAGRYFAMMLLPSSFYGSAIVQLSWISGSMSQPAVKRAACIALINCICNTPNSKPVAVIEILEKVMS